MLRVTVEREHAELVRMTDAVARNVLRMFGTDEKLIAEFLALPLAVARCCPARSMSYAKSPVTCPAGPGR